MKKFKFNRQFYNKLNWYDKMVFNHWEQVYLDNNEDIDRLKAQGIYWLPIINEQNNQYRLAMTPITDRSRGRINSYVDIKNKNHLFENKKKESIAKKMIDNKKGFIYGDAGIGKSHVIAYVANDLNKKGLSIYYQLSATVAKLIWNFETQEKTLSDLKNYDVVLIDDIGSELLNETIIRNYYMLLLKDRIDNDKPIYFTSNYTIVELAKRISKIVDDVSVNVIIDRIKTLKPIKYEDDNFR